MFTTTLALAALSTLAGGSGIAWFGGSHAEAIESAAKNNQPVLTYFWANTDNCARLYSETMSNDQVIAEMGDMVCFSANAGDDSGRALLDKYKLTTVPALLVIGANGEAEEMLTGFIDASTFVFEIQRIKRGENTISDLRAKLSGKHETLEAEIGDRKMLSEKLRATGDEEAAEKMLQALFKRDKKGSTLAGARAHTDQLVREIAHKGGNEAAHWDLRPLVKFVKRIPNEAAQFEGRLLVAGLELDAGKQAGGLASYMEAWKGRPEGEETVGAGIGIVSRLVEIGDALTKRQKQFALDVASELVAMVDHAPTDTKSEVASEDSSDWKDGGDGGDGDGMRPYALYHLALCQSLNGAQGDAIATMERVIKMQPDQGMYQEFLAELTGEES